MLESDYSKNELVKLTDLNGLDKGAKAIAGTPDATYYFSLHVNTFGNTC